MTRNRFDRSFDAATELKDAGLIAASAAAQVGGSDQILDLAADDGVDPAGNPPGGSVGSRINGTVVIDIAEIEIATGDEIYDIVAQVSDSATFASGIVNVGGLNIGDSSVSDGGAADGVVGHYEFGITNEQNGRAYRYLRLFTVVAGTIATGIDYTAHFAKAA